MERGARGLVEVNCIISLMDLSVMGKRTFWDGDILGWT